jgi:GTP-binding protein HflX
MGVTPSALTLLLGLDLSQSGEWGALDSLNELADLSWTAGLHVVYRMVQKRDKPHPKCYIGEGKLEELKALVTEYKVTVVITDDELSPAQHKHLESVLCVKVMDRTGLILDIFAQHARTAESQLQVELAQLEYLLPRLTRMWTHLSRLGGGIGTRGPGEKQLEVDKRQIRVRLSTIRKKLEKIKSHRENMRQHRDRIPALTGVLVGYTNAGKSTLLNALTDADVLAKDQLFATLDPTTRYLQLKDRSRILVTDTVGFIQKLPHQLVSSFRATLEEAIDADFLLHVVDVSHPKAKVFYQTSMSILTEIGAAHVPQILVLNKADQDTAELWKNFHDIETPRVILSAKTGLGVDKLTEEIERFVRPLKESITLDIPYSRFDILDLVYQYGSVQSREDLETGVRVAAFLNKNMIPQLLKSLHSS